ncbi:hypothetical protein WA026_015220 [Henosepilachna vigintioctopunctata]|uniref:Uncharacterized protein n=1 Tax=Henosepilachna vigintioctopunctata TaxID=420089 RepID=A0AAW1TL01_9CUCU
MILDKGLICSILIASVFADVELSKDLDVRMDQINLKCGKENNFEKKDFYQITHNVPLTKDEIKRYQCFMKCFHQTDGTIDQKGFVNFTRVDENLSMLKFDEEDKKNIIACFKKIKPVIKCEDVVPVVKCIPQKKKLN